MSNTTIIILASGSGSRFQGIKQLLDIDGVPMIRRVCENALASNCKNIVLVLGAYHDKILPNVSDLDVHIITNHNWKLGVSESIKMAMDYVSNALVQSDSVLITLGDLPYVNAKDYNELLSLCDEHPKKLIASSYNGVIGAPAIFPPTQWSDLELLTGDMGAREILRKSNSIISCPLSSAGKDIDRKSDLSLS